MNIELFTSIPPLVNRKIGDADLGQNWTRQCINSWKQAGYKVISVNSANESSSIALQYSDIEVLEVDRDGSTEVGRPLVYFSDMLGLAISRNEDYFGIINADVSIFPQAIPLLKNWRPANGFAYSNRLDIDDLNYANPRPHGGLDFALVSARDLKQLEIPDFLFGTPWWDYWLPLALNAVNVMGRRLTLHGLPLIAHLFHSEQWSHEQFLTNFSCFTHSLSNIVSSRQDLPESAFTFNAASGIPGLVLNMCLNYARATSGVVHQLNSPLDLG